MTMAAGKWQQPRKQRPHWQQKQRLSGGGDTVSGIGGNIGTTMMATTGNEDYNVGRALRHCQRRQLVWQLWSRRWQRQLLQRRQSWRQPSEGGRQRWCWKQSRGWQQRPEAAEAVAVAKVRADINQQRAAKTTTAAIAVGKRRQARREKHQGRQGWRRGPLRRRRWPWRWQWWQWQWARGQRQEKRLMLLGFHIYNLATIWRKIEWCV